MLAEELINPMIPVLRPSDSVGRALDVMQDYGARQLALVEEDDYKGLYDEDTLLNWPNDAEQLADLPVHENPVFATPNQHMYELIGMANRHQLQLIPVLDEDQSYTGAISVSEMLARFADTLGAQELGAVVVLKMNNRDYSLTDISRLVESNNTKILSSYFAGAHFGAPDEATLTLKLNRTDVSAVIATLERFGYNIEGTFASAPVDSIDRQRLDMLLKYLEV